MTAPLPGSFVRPVGKYHYCLEVVNVLPEADGLAEQWQCKRWGLDEHKQPINDDRGHSMHYLNNLKQTAPGIWKDEWSHGITRWTCCPLYYRQIEIEDPLYYRSRRPQQMSLL